MGQSLLRGMFTLVFPGGLLFLGALGFLRPQGLPPWCQGPVAVLPYLALTFGLVFGWYFASARMLLSLACLAVADQALVRWPPEHNAGSVSETVSVAATGVSSGVCSAPIGTSFLMCSRKICRGSSALNAGTLCFISRAIVSHARGAFDWRGAAEGRVGSGCGGPSSERSSPRGIVLERFVLVRRGGPWYLSGREVRWRPTHWISDNGCCGPGMAG